MELIQSYAFGNIRIAGRSYHNDVIILGREVVPEWWRKQGHLLTPEDLSTVVGARPDILVVGTGSSDMLRIDPTVQPFLSEQGIRLEAGPTARAVARYNILVASGTDAAAALHLTC